MEDLHSAAENLLRGETHWITFQNRVLAPAIIEGICAVTGLSWLQGFRVLIAGCLAGGAGVLLWRSWRDTGRWRRGIGQSALWFGFMILFNNVWSYPWDFTGMLLFLLLAVWAQDHFRALEDLRSKWLIFVCAMLVFNRESSLIVGVSLFSVVVLKWANRKPRTLALKTAALLTGIVAVNTVAVIAIRHAMFVVSTKPGVVAESEIEVGNFLMLIANWNLFKGVWWDNNYGLSVITLWILGLINLIWLVQLGRDWVVHRQVSAGRMLLVGLLGWSTLGVVGLGYILELRVYCEIIPILVIGLVERDSKCTT